MDIHQIPTEFPVVLDRSVWVPVRVRPISGALEVGSYNYADPLRSGYEVSAIPFELILYTSPHRIAGLWVQDKCNTIYRTDSTIADTFFHAGYLCGSCKQVFMLREGVTIRESMNHNCLDRLHGTV